jgi:D-proline reductase (dithiol) PrdB
MLNLALISTAGAYIDGTEPFDMDNKDGDLAFREIPVEVDAADLRYSAKGYDPTNVIADRNCQIPIDRLTEYQQNAVIGALNNVWWSVSSHIPNAQRVADEMGPKLAERLQRYETQAALLIPASRLCHQTVGILARVIEEAGIPTMVISVAPNLTDRVKPPRTAYYTGDLGSVAGKPNWREYQLRVLDEALRWTETFDQPGSRKLAVDLESQVEAARGER